jgi:hypothetical protein
MIFLCALIYQPQAFYWFQMIQLNFFLLNMKAKDVIKYNENIRNLCFIFCHFKINLVFIITGLN